jgi:hypothetical protein
MEGVVSPAELPTRVPPVLAVYHRVVEHPEEDRDTVPVPHLEPPVAVGLVGLDKTINWPVVVDDPLTEGFEETTRILYTLELVTVIGTVTEIGDEDPDPIIVVPDPNEPEAVDS